MEKYIQRLLFPHNGTWHLDDGLFPTPSKKYSFYNKETINFKDAIETQNCLIILGESGIGKTEFLKYNYNKLSEAKIWIDLRKISDAESINNEIFNKEFQSLYKKKSFIYLFLDGLDESLTECSKIYFNLLSKLKKYDHSKLKLIISCRTYYFPKSFETSLREYFNIPFESNILFDITPFTIEDVENHLKQEGILDFEAFYKKIRLYKLKPFIAKPITLFSIVDLYKRNLLCESHSNIYLNAVKKLLSEQNSFRKEQHRFSSINSFAIPLEQKIYLVGRIALMLLSNNKKSLYLGDIDKTPIEALNLENINYGLETFSGEIINISNIDFGEILSSSLFNTSDDETYFFNNDVFIEFLSAWYLYKQDIALEVKLNYIAINGQIIPLFIETASWLAQIDDKFFDLIFEKNSHLLLKSKPIFNNAQNEILISQAVELLKAEKIGLYDIKREKLVHIGLLKQIKSIIKNNMDNNAQVCMLCMDLIFHGNLLDLQKYLYNIATNSSDSRLKEDALEYLSAIGNKFYKNKLCKKYNEYKSLLGSEDFDVNDRLRASYLMVLSSNDFDINKILDLITLRKNMRHFGLYEMYLNDFPNKLNENNIIFALKWAMKNEEKWRIQYSRDNITTDIINKSILFINDTKVFNAISELLYNTLKANHYSLRNSYEIFKKGTDLAKSLFISLINKHLKIKDFKTSNYTAYSIYDSFLNDDDFIWLCNEYKNLRVETEKNKLKILIKKIIAYRFPEKLTEKTIELLPLYQKFNTDEILIQDFGKFNTRVYKYKPQKWEVEEEKRKNSNTKLEVQKNIEKALLDVKNNPVNSAIYIIQVLTMEERSAYVGNFSLKVENYPAWNNCTFEIQTGILKAFYEFFKNAEAPRLQDYIEGNQFQYSWFILAFIPEMVKRGIISKIEIKKYLNSWIPFVLIIPKFDNNYDIYQDFVEFYFNLMPKELIDALIKVIKYNFKAESPDALRGFDRVNNQNLNFILYELLKKNINDFSIKYITYILKYLLSKNFSGILDFGHKLLNKFKDNEDAIIELAPVLLCFGTDKTWKKVYSTFSKENEDYSFGRNLLAEYVDKTPYVGGLSVFENVSQATLADYYVWLYYAFPYEEEDKKYQKKGNIASLVANTDRLSDFRRYILNKIKDHGYTETLEIIGKKIPALNDKFWFSNFAFDTYNNLLLREWMKLDSQKIFDKSICKYNPINIDTEAITSTIINNLKSKTNEYELKSSENQKDLDQEEFSESKEIEKDIEIISIPSEHQIDIYVEDTDDEEIYTELYKIMLGLNFISSNPKLNFISVSDHKSNASGGCQEVIKLIRKHCSRGGANMVGLIDKDYDNQRMLDEKKDISDDIRDRIFLLERYSIENYILEPLAVFTKNPQKFPNSNNQKYKRGDEEKLSEYSETELQAIVNEFFAVIQPELTNSFGNKYKPTRDNKKEEVVFANTKKITYKKWFYSLRGKDLKTIVNKKYPRNKINDISGDGLETIKRLFHKGYIPIEIIDKFKNIQKMI